MRLLVYSHKNKIKMFWYYSHNIFIRLLRSRKTAEISATFDVTVTETLKF